VFECIHVSFLIRACRLYRELQQELDRVDRKIKECDDRVQKNSALMADLKVHHMSHAESLAAMDSELQFRIASLGKDEASAKKVITFIEGTAVHAPFSHRICRGP